MYNFVYTGEDRCIILFTQVKLCAEFCLQQEGRCRALFTQVKVCV